MKKLIEDAALVIGEIRSRQPLRLFMIALCTKYANHGRFPWDGPKLAKSLLPRDTDADGDVILEWLEVAYMVEKIVEDGEAFGEIRHPAFRPKVKTKKGESAKSILTLWDTIFRVSTGSDYFRSSTLKEVGLANNIAKAMENREVTLSTLGDAMRIFHEDRFWGGRDFSSFASKCSEFVGKVLARDGDETAASYWAALKK